ncbi:cytochrome c, class I [Sulfuricurvum kujiense DSM 16994]|uniref:Cytochrome c, class I n=1 Tax=Sulfuricurvum kujiense (strain ATCC BAA-921 / DSM 16994 / JCM 11577 / YK-1) TaxID=709032 RepID=E4U1M6_SULKY|nr:c-type cytochrome [Sulfuricurvum kujiense]ADR33462.1 cytochrome c, class I [Sulfuricurvum kujiense DSM 16994]
MKIFIPVLCSLLLIGCSESTPKQASESNGSQEISTPLAEENSSAAAPAELNETVAAPSAAAAPAAVENASVDANALFSQKCASCHGAKAEKSALNKSQIIATLSEQQIADALKGYQNGTYGREMKALMQGQAKGLNDAQIDALAKYISAL